MPKSPPPCCVDALEVKEREGRICAGRYQWGCIAIAHSKGKRQIKRLKNSATSAVSAETPSDLSLLFSFFCHASSLNLR